MRSVVIRQRPSIGDCLLLGPLLREIKSRDPGGKITVITDPQYMGAGLVQAFRGMSDCVDEILQVPSMEWTTEDNAQISPEFSGAVHATPPAILTKRGVKIFNCNTAFMHFEREHRGNTPYGISEFWVKHFNLHVDGMELRPKYTVPETEQENADTWLWSQGIDPTRAVGLVMRAGSSVRDWDIDGRLNDVCLYLHSNGYIPITIDPTMKPSSTYARPCVGRRLEFIGGLIKRLPVLVTPDTGLLHLAQAVGTKTVALWGIMEPKLRVSGYNTVVIPAKSLGYCGREDRSCQCPWKFQQWSCMRRLTLPMICDGIHRALNER